MNRFEVVEAVEDVEAANVVGAVEAGATRSTSHMEFFMRAIYDP